jgi:hypothetical protein
VSDDDSAVADLLASYQLAVHTGNRHDLKGVFGPDALVSYPDRDRGCLVTITASAFADEVAELVAAGETVVETTRALRIDVAGAVAVAKVDFNLQIADEHYLGTDLFSLAKLADGWRITQKLYDMERAPTREESHGH